MPNEALQELNRKIQEAERDSKLDILNADYLLSPSWAIRKTQATQELAVLNDTYKAEMANKVLYMYVYGDKGRSDKFAYISYKEAFTTTIKGNDLFEELGGKVFASLGRDKQAGTFQASLVVEEMLERDTQRFLKLSFIDSLSVSMFRNLNTVAEAEQWVREFLESNLGFDFLAERVQNNAINASKSEKFDGEIFPVVITGLNQSEIDSLMLHNKNSFKVILSEEQEVDKDLVFGTLKEIRSTLKSQGK